MIVKNYFANKTEKKNNIIKQCEPGRNTSCSVHARAPRLDNIVLLWHDDIVKRI